MQKPIWTQLAPSVSKLAIYFILKANYKPDKWYDGTRLVTVPPGSFITSYASTAAACNLSAQQTRDAFGHLERTQFATYRRTHCWTMVTLVDYEVYQPTVGNENTQENTDTTGKRTTDKEVKKIRTNTYASPGRNACVDSLPLNNEVPAQGALLVGESVRRMRLSPEQTAEQEAWFSQWWPE